MRLYTSGPLRHIVEIQAVTYTTSASGERTPVYTTAVTRRADMQGGEIQEKWEAGQKKGFQQITFTFRFYANLTPQYRILHGSTAYNITSITDPDCLQRWQVVQCLRELT